VLPYLNTLQGRFTLDDHLIIQNNPRIHGPHSSALALLTTTHRPLYVYRPLTMLTYLANARISTSPHGFHLINIVLHAFATLLAFQVAEALLGKIRPALAAAALFAVHPIHTEAVSNIAGRAEILAAILVFTSLILAARASTRSARSPRLTRAASVLTFALALCAKESAFTAIALQAIVDHKVRDDWDLAGGIKRSLPYLGVGMGYLALRLFLVGALTVPPQFRAEILNNPLALVATLPRLGTAITILWRYLSLLSFPLVLSADYSFNEIPPVLSILDPRLVLAGIGLSALAAVVLVYGRRRPELPTAAAFVIIPLGLTANIAFPIGTIMAERLLYLPSLGWCLATGWLLCHEASAKTRKLATVALLVLVAAFAARTWLRNPVWYSDDTLWHATVWSSPWSAKAHYNLGVAEDIRGNLDAAAREYRRSLDIYPQYDEAAFALGKVYQQQHRPSLALEWYEATLSMNWRFTRAHYNIGVILSNHGDVDGAEAAFRAGLQTEPTQRALLVGLGLAQLNQGKLFQAREVLLRAASGTLDPAVGRTLSEALILLDQRSDR